MKFFLNCIFLTRKLVLPECVWYKKAEIIDERTIMHFDQLLDTVSKSHTDLAFPANWCQGRTAFGGISAAMLYTAMRNKIASDREILSLSTNFVGPLIADTPFDISLTILREGKNTTQIEARITQNEKVAVIALACFAIKRDSNVIVENKQSCPLSPVNENNLIPYIEGITPQFFQHMSFNIQKGAMPFSKAKDGELAGWMRLKETPSSVTTAHILALTDAWPPAQLQMFSKPAPASSMSWYIEFLPHKPLAADAWLAFDAFTHHSRDGYACEEANIYTQSGELIAMSRQTVALFD